MFSWRSFLADSFSIDISLSLGQSKKNTGDACSVVPQIAEMAVRTLMEHAQR